MTGDLVVPVDEMTFLEWLLIRLIGQPVRYGKKGESYWHCPFAATTHANGADNDPSFHTLPSTMSMKQRWYCHGCRQEHDEHRGDEYDLLRRFYPDQRSWPARQARMEELRVEHANGVEPTPLASSYRDQPGTAGNGQSAGRKCPHCGAPGMAGEHDLPLTIHTDAHEEALNMIAPTDDNLELVERTLLVAARKQLSLCRLASFVRCKAIASDGGDFGPVENARLDKIIRGVLVGR
jgi:hypothetical protein